MVVVVDAVVGRSVNESMTQRTTVSDNKSNAAAGAMDLDSFDSHKHDLIVPECCGLKRTSVVQLSVRLSCTVNRYESDEQQQQQQQRRRWMEEISNPSRSKRVDCNVVVREQDCQAPSRQQTRFAPWVGLIDLFSKSYSRVKFISRDVNSVEDSDAVLSTS